VVVESGKKFNRDINMALDSVYHRGPLPRLAVIRFPKFRRWMERKSSKSFPSEDT
jgi:hypothetical protein